MTGCDKIVEEILEEARQAVRTKLDTAEQKAAAVAAEGRRNAQEQAATILAEGLEQEEGIRRAARLGGRAPGCATPSSRIAGGSWTPP